MQLVAHRGFAAVAPENTLQAVDAAAAAGANAVEVDVRGASDGTPVVVHDETVTRVTDSSGPVADYDPDALAAMRVEGSSVGVPTLAAVLTRAHEHGLAVNVEVKEVGVAAAVVDVIRSHDVPTAAVWVSAFDAAVLERVDEAAARVPATDAAGGSTAEARLATAYLTATLRSHPVETAVDLGCDAIHPQYRLTFAGDLVERAHRAGLHVYLWTLDSQSIADAVAYRQVEGLIADVPLDL